MRMKYLKRAVVIASILLLSGCNMLQECDTYPEGRRYKSVVNVRNEQEKYTEQMMFLLPDLSFKVEEGDSKATAVKKYITSIATALLGNGCSHYWQARYYDDGKVPDEWKSAITCIVKDIADKEFQEKEWLSEKENATSPRDLYCALFNGFSFVDFLKTPDKTRTEEQQLFGKKMVREMIGYFKLRGKNPDSEVVFDDPLWDNVRSTAQNYYDSLTEDRTIANASP
ncbi:MAG: hypothetical protein K1000chlam4_00157 [Chlamydiae bacterium]|nr:hypothetical protein [Chlamydiota bacterium]